MCKSTRMRVKWIHLLMVLLGQQRVTTTTMISTLTQKNFRVQVWSYTMVVGDQENMNTTSIPMAPGEVDVQF
ncbi:hypothetical protein CEXT_174431 [Caerostris extrusa]|uniref:Uncharacterized protein n=1 Tax=Caerostris extrusa TaxID=172846 RepID=A0AAV4XSW2_CAEEX|nr:hypothetical protein CEXT_174431 [Caerostris extrusa]